MLYYKMLNQNLPKACYVGRPVPFNRTDLLVPRIAPSSGLQMRPPKYPKPLARPDTAMTMMLNLEMAGYAGRDLEPIYEARVQNPPAVRQSILERTRIMRGRLNAMQAISGGVSVMPTVSGPDVVAEQFVDYAVASNTVVMLGQPSILQSMSRSQSVQPMIEPMEQFLENAQEQLEAGDKLNLQEGIEASSSYNPPETPTSRRERMSADTSIIREGTLDPESAAYVLHTPGRRSQRSGRMIDTTAETADANQFSRSVIRNRRFFED